VTARPALAALLASAAVAAAGSGQSPQQPVFRSGTDVVTVDVAVREGGTPVGGLTAKDFVLLDNGVAQTIDSVEMEAVAVDVSILIDANEDVAGSVAALNRQVPSVAALLRAGDRIRVSAINGRVIDVLRAQPAAAASAQAPVLKAEGLSSAYDGLAAALLRAVDPARRHIIVALTNGIDAMSTLDAAAVREIARRSPAVLHIMQVDVARESNSPDASPDVRWSSARERLQRRQCGLIGLCRPTRNFWRPYDQKEFDVLKEAAEATGGALHVPGIFTSAAGTFRKVLGDYRRSYLLRYTPQGVAREGWHEIAVSVPAHPSYTVHARRGYAVDRTPEPDGSAARPPIDAPATLLIPPRQIDAMVDAYNRADYGGLEKELARATNAAGVIAEFRKAGNPWPANPGREAAMVIELADAALRTRRVQARDAARDLLRSHRVLVRHPLGPDAFERHWLWAAVASLQGSNEPDLLREFADYALTRFPDEPRFALARAFAADRSRAFADPGGRDGAAQAAHVREVTERYDAAARYEQTAAEARVRKAFFLHRIERHADALAELDAVDGASADRDAMTAYLRRVFRGRVLEALARFDEARAAYQSAHDLRPSAQSPQVALMRLLVRAGEREAAEALATAIQTAPAEAFDPWWVYWLGDYRHYGSAILTLREHTR
jgi:VWFA-related protein